MVIASSFNVAVPFAALATGTDGGTSTPVGAANPLPTATLGSRQLVVKGSIPNTTSYAAANLAMGGLIAIATGLPAGTVFTGVLKLKIRFSDISAAVSTYIILFDASPTASTVTDNTTLTVAAADVAKVMANIAQSAGGWQGPNAAGNVWVASVNVPRITVDASGNIYFAYISTAATTYTSSNVLFYDLSGTY